MLLLRGNPMTMPDMQPSEMRDSLDKVISSYTTNPHENMMDDIQQLFATHQRRAVTEGKIEELERLYSVDGRRPNKEQIAERIAELKALNQPEGEK